jgi:hypothetical protein
LVGTNNPNLSGWCCQSLAAIPIEGSGPPAPEIYTDRGGTSLQPHGFFLRSQVITQSLGGAVPHNFARHVLPTAANQSLFPSAFHPSEIAKAQASSLIRFLHPGLNLRKNYSTASLHLIRILRRYYTSLEYFRRVCFPIGIILSDMYILLTMY